ncbi:protein NUCLEAR FUSION DEFECTIVE 4-like [Hevea brasiliensis]|nr:protein NUCLEAR FUSION DEFECTIVE 4-like [Hevea brasiliensis]
MVASETGKLFGFLSGAAVDYLPPSMILVIGLIFGLVGYGGQYLSIAHKIPDLSYWQVIFLNALAGNSTCWISTYCSTLAIRNFRDWQGTLIEITSSYSGLSEKIYSILVGGIQGRKSSQNSVTYLLFTSLAPIVVGLTVAIKNYGLKCLEHRDIDMSPIAFLIAISTGIYVVIESVAPSFTHLSLQLQAVILVLVLMIPFAVASFIALHQFTTQKCNSQVMPEPCTDIFESKSKRVIKEFEIAIDKERCADESKAAEVDRGTEQVLMVGNENGLKELLIDVDFWLFYMVNACGAAVGKVYLINLEQIFVSRSSSVASSLFAMSCVFSFFGRNFSVMFKWYTRKKSIISNPALTVLLILPMPVAFFLLINDSSRCLYISTGILGACSGALNAISASTMHEAFGCNNFVVKKTIIQTNIPLGLLVFGCLAALNYQKEGEGNHGICLGLQCYSRTFIIWGSISLAGAILSVILLLRKQNLCSHKS